MENSTYNFKIFNILTLWYCIFWSKNKRKQDKKGQKSVKDYSKDKLNFKIRKDNSFEISISYHIIYGY